MKRITLIVMTTLFATVSYAQTCSTSGNVVVYANYDGGILTINCDLNIPNLKIGICTYEAVQVTLTGPYVGNVTEVIYAGYNADNNNCGIGVFSTSITGVSPSIVDILFAPPVTYTDSFGYPYIICGYTCTSGYQGGCNTSIQVAEYFTDTFGGSLYLYDTQYGCWNNETVSISQGGSCCPGATPIPQAFFNSEDQLLCAGQCIDFSDESSGGTITSWNWSFPGGNPASSTSQNPQNICYLNNGIYTATLTVGNSFGSTSYASQINVISCGIPGCTYPDALNYNPTATVDDQTCIFNCAGDTCPADFNDDGIIGVSDLLAFIGIYGTSCPE
ncbi:MAG: hypothetical protein RL220_6 [Bacteroidota bacterium]